MQDSNRKHALLQSQMAVIVAAVAMHFLILEAHSQTHVVGRWVEPAPVDGNYLWNEETMHAIHLSSREILLFYGPDCDTEEPRLYDAYSGLETTVPTPAGLTLGNCQGHAALADGSVLLVGGSCGIAAAATEKAWKYNLAGGPAGPWQQLAGGMSIARWYPTCTTLHDGRVLVFGGTGFGGTTGHPYDPPEYPTSPHIPEIYTPATNQWDTLTNAVRYEAWALSYPFMFQIPDGRVACIGPAFSFDETAILDISGEGQWIHVTNGTSESGDRASAVMFEPGKILTCGGTFAISQCPQSAAECPLSTSDTGIIDLSGANPEVAEWLITDGMDLNVARRDHNLIVTPTGQIIVVGGLRSSCIPVPDENCFCNCNPNCICCSDNCESVMEAELSDPLNPEDGWEVLASMTIPRGYHSVAVLLPDASILVAGGEEISDEEPSLNSAERFEPPYLFSGDGVYAQRPIIGQAPTIISYGNQFSVRLANTPTAFTISKVCLIRPAAVSHGFDQDQRRVPLTFQQSGTVLQVTAPPSGMYAPPGHYMLFIVDTSGVPSIARYLRITTPTGP